MMTLLMLLSTLLAGTVKEPATGIEFADQLQLGQEKIACTGADYRTKFFVKVYAIAHYGAPGAWPKSADPNERLDHWISAPALKACVLSITYDIPYKKMRDAIAEGLDTAGYQGAGRDTFLGIFTHDLKKGDEFRFVAQADGTLTAEYNKSELGKWTDPELTKALWTIWLGKKSVLDNRENLVKQPEPKNQ